jgi:integrase
MARTKKGSLPTYRLHRPTGQAVVTIDGQDYYLGPFGSARSKKKYNRLTDAWAARQERGAAEAEELPALSEVRDVATVKELILQYTVHARMYYSASEGQQREVGCIQDALQIVKDLYGRSAAHEFGPKALKAVRRAMVARDWARGYVNHQINRVKRMFRWATEEELIPATNYHALQSVRGLRKGTPDVRETRKVRPVPVRDVRKVLRRVRPMVRAMILLQLFSGCRPGEVCRLKPRRIIRSEAVWVFRLGKHKTAHHGKRRRIFIGPRAQKVLGPWLKDVAPDEYVFSPARDEAVRQAERRAKRKTPLWPSHQKRLAATKKATPERPKGERYDTASYRRAIKRACKQAGVPPWSPNRLRHLAATRIRRRHGIETARIILGHSSLVVTQVYAEADRKKALEVMGQIG